MQETFPKAIFVLRVALGLVVAPAIPNWLSGCLMFILSLGPVYGSFGRFMSRYMMATQLWAFAVGLVLFFLMPRDFRRTLPGAMSLGAAGAFLFPPAWFIYISKALPDSLADLGIMALWGALAMPFGLLGGWNFWLLAMRSVPKVNGPASQPF